MEFENLSKTSKSSKKSKRSSTTRVGVIYTNLLELDERFNEFSQEILDLEKSGVKIDSLLSKLEDISKLVKNSKSKLKQGGRTNAQKDS